jgi:hypothetical protein
MSRVGEAAVWRRARISLQVVRLVKGGVGKAQASTNVWYPFEL